MNIKYENSADIFSSDYEVVVPLIISENDGELEIEAYDDISQIVDDICQKFGKRLFSKKAIDYIDKHLEPYVNAHEYYREIVGKYKWYEVFTLDDISKINYDTINDDTYLLTSDHLLLENLTTFDLKELLDKKLETYVVVKDSKIVCLSSVNEHSDDQRMLELTVETSREYRSMGFGASAITALGSYLLTRGFSLSYVTSRYNRASISLAKKLDFKHSGRFYAYTAFKD